MSKCSDCWEVEMAPFQDRCGKCMDKWINDTYKANMRQKKEDHETIANLVVEKMKAYLNTQEEKARKPRCVYWHECGGCEFCEDEEWFASPEECLQKCKEQLEKDSGLDQHSIASNGAESWPQYIPLSRSIGKNTSDTASNQSNTPQKIKLLKDRAGYPAGEYVYNKLYAPYHFDEETGYDNTTEVFFRYVNTEDSKIAMFPDIIKATSWQGIRSELTDGAERLDRSIEFNKSLDPYEECAKEIRERWIARHDMEGYKWWELAQNVGAILKKHFPLPPTK